MSDGEVAFPGCRSFFEMEVVRQAALQGGLPDGWRALGVCAEV
jgi:hypothetical protein